MNACFACEKQLTEDVAIKGHYLCSNQRCIRFGLVTTVYLAPQEPPKTAKQEQEVASKDTPTTQELLDRIEPLEENKDLATPEAADIKEAEALKQDGTDLPTTGE